MTNNLIKRYSVFTHGLLEKQVFSFHLYYFSFYLSFRLVRKLVFLFFNVNVYLMEIPCLNKVTIPYQTDNIQFGLPRAGIEKRHHAPKTGIIFSQNTDNRQKYSEKANQFAAVTFLTIHFLFVLFATVAFLCNETRERRSPIQAKKRH